MLIGEIGRFFQTTQKIPYLGDRTFLDFDYLIINFDYLLATLEENVIHDMGIKRQYENRKNKLIEFISHKEVPLICFTPAPKIILFADGASYKRYELSFFVPFLEFVTETERGTRMTMLNNSPFCQFLKKYETHFQYESYFTKYNGKIIAETPHTKNVLAYYNSNVIFLPAIKKNLVYEEEKEFFQELTGIIIKLKKGEKEELPNWASDYLLPNEKELINEINLIQNEILEKEQIKLQKKDLLNKINLRKILFTGTGNDLEEQVKEVLKELGFQILESESNRDDLIIKYGSRIGVVEIKGVNGSGAEKHAAQLEKWVANYLELTGQNPKGILLINSYREKELKDRKETVWPDQMIPYCKQRGHCLLSTIQLLGIYSTVISDPMKKEKLIDSIFETVGVYNEFEDWSSYISHTDNSSDQVS